MSLMPVAKIAFVICFHFIMRKHTHRRWQNNDDNKLSKSIATFKDLFYINYQQICVYLFFL